MKIKKEDKENFVSTKRIPLTETTLNRVMGGHDEFGYIIISGMRDNLYRDKNGNVYSVFSNEDKKSSEDKEIEIGTQDWVDENNKRTNKLRNLLKSKKYSYIPVYGGFKEEGSDSAKIEKSFIVFPYEISTKEYKDFDEFKRTLLDIGKSFQQDAILIKAPDSNPVYVDCLTEKPDDYVFTNKKVNDIAQEYFTALKKWDDSSRKDKSHFTTGKPQRFTFESLYMDDFPNSISEHRRRSLNGELVQFKQGKFLNSRLGFEKE